ncbi:TPA: hypothetical protein U1C38_002163 [Streptococcus suis]|nr:hypothetical protein [Streptococcus suis]
MKIINLLVEGRLIGSSKVKDYDSGLETGQTQITLGSRTPEGRFIQANVKIDSVNTADFEALYDEKVEILLEDVIMTPYKMGDRVAVSIKAKSATIEHI